MQEIIYGFSSFELEKLASVRKDIHFDSGCFLLAGFSQDKRFYSGICTVSLKYLKMNCSRPKRLAKFCKFCVIFS